jgi:small ligand-binding sensory domain FIST
VTTGARYAAAMSEHPVAAQAVGEIAGQILEELEGDRADLMLLFVSPHFTGTTEDVVGVLRAVLAPRALIGATHAAVVGGSREVEDTPAISVWAACGGGLHPRVMSLDVVPGEHGGADLVGWPAPEDAEPVADGSTLLLLADPFTFPVDGVLRVLDAARPELQVVGGMASAAAGPGGNRLVADDRVVERGAVGVLLGPDAAVDAVVAQGCRPVGQPYVVTAVDGNHVVALAGRPALVRLEELARSMSDEDRDSLLRGLHVGLVVDERRIEFAPGDFLVRNVLGAREADGALAVGASVEVGQTLQFQVRDARAADADLRAALAGRSAAASLLFTCTGRGQRLFGRPDHDATMVRDAFGAIPVAGGFCAGELGPVGGHNHVHGFTASLALFH